MKKSKKTYVSDIKDGDSVRDVFLVAKKGKAVSRSGNPYLIISLTDKSGDIEARIWDRASELDKNFDSGDFVAIEALANQYQGRPQLNVTLIDRVDQQNVNLNDFLKSSGSDPLKVFSELVEVYKGIQNRHLRDLIFSFLDDEAFQETFKMTPAATDVHHAYVGGLMEHVLSVAKLAVKVVSHYSELDGDVLLAGVFFHDIGKVREISHERHFSYTDKGRLLGHIMMGCEMIEEAASRLKGFPDELKMRLKHMVISHHGQLEFGSPKLPQTREALVLHFLDDMDAKLNTIGEMIRGSQGKSWTDYNKFMGRIFYKGKLDDKDEKPQPGDASHSNEPRGKKPPKKKSKKTKEQELDLFK